MNNNRNSNRRRGRSNRGQGGGNQSNRIDSRARGNAPQMLEKYKKLAHDASLNGDRVQTEYYLQFADHYFRVIADNKVQKDEHPGRRDDREQGDDADGDYEESSNRNARSRGQRDDRGGDDGDIRHGSEGEEASQEDEGGNPFVRETKQRPGNRGRKARANGEEQPAGVNPDALPPAIGAPRDDATDRSESDDETARPRRRTRRPRSDDSGDETLEAVG